jgi:hypothetical protein
MATKFPAQLRAKSRESVPGCSGEGEKFNERIFRIDEKTM